MGLVGQSSLEYALDGLESLLSVVRGFFLRLESRFSLGCFESLPFALFPAAFMVVSGWFSTIRHNT